MDPLSVTASSLAFLIAAKAACDLIAKLIDAPNTLASAKDDLQSMIDSVEALKTYLNDRTGLAQSDQLIRVLMESKKRCEAFQALLKDVSKHSVDRIDGKLSLRDRGKLLLKESEITRFREDIGCLRVSINVAAIPSMLSSGESTAAAIEGLTLQMKNAGIDISRQLEDIKKQIEALDEAGVAPESPSMLMWQSRKEALSECRKLIEESCKTAEKNNSFKAAFGNLIVAENGITFQVLATEKDFKDVNLKYGDANIGVRAFSMQGLVDPGVLTSVVDTATARIPTAQKSSSTAGSECGRATTERNNTVKRVPLTIEARSEETANSNLWAVLAQEERQHEFV